MASDEAASLFAGYVLIGTTADEVLAHYSANPLMQNPSADALAATFGDDATLSRFRMRRPGATALDLLADLATEETYHRPIMHFADAVTARGGKPYVYFFDWAPPASRFRSCHNIELPSVFATLVSARASEQFTIRWDLAPAQRCEQVMPWRHPAT